MSKYVIEFDKEQLLEYDKDTATYFRVLYKAKGFNALVFDKNGLDKLTPLDKELEEAYQKGKHDAEQDLARAAYEEAYQKGYEVGQHEATTLEYQQGLDEAWECAKRIALTKTDKDCPYFTVTELEKIFGCSTLQSVFYTYSASEAIEKVKAYEEQQKADEIKVGDEVCFVFAGGETIEPFIVFSIKDDNGKKYYEGIQVSDGRWVGGGLKYYKTGRHFPQVAELLEAMKGGAE